ncbi:PREDICTED: magnesium-dependent phosphatase 1-like isoform X3 [Wasmannia auropunctata]|uniref:magnesium-dependent phosphatase 1-like isoform X3 n=1 Tax=Wasmannia auropunctata TaxID=64793 RepID=UPI0005F06EFC|nr:PREDICTED: magnesium-dependent phosphatase 1-like isoform X3 [Wasmannia auropunctata]
MEKKPKVIVFDLGTDIVNVLFRYYTLWPFWVDTHVNPPFKMGAQNKVVDLYGHTIRHYSDVPDVLKQLSGEGYELGVASRTTQIKGAKQLIDLFGWKKYFNIQKSSHVDYKDMMFFDDESRNIVEVGKLGVHAVLVGDGVSRGVVQDALRSFSKQ